MDYKFMSRTFFSFILAVTLLTGTLFILQAKSSAAPQEFQLGSFSGEGISFVEADDRGLSFVLKTAVIHDAPNNGLITSPGLNAVMQEPGAPELPYFSTYIAVPPEATVAIQVQQQEVNTLADVVVQAAAEPTMSFVNTDPDSPFPQTAVSPPSSILRTPNAAIYSADTLYPPLTYQLSDPVYVRDMRLVKLDLYPLHYNPVRQEMQQAVQMQVNLSFVDAQFDTLQPAPSKDDVVQNGVASMVLNFEQGKAWRSLPMAEGDLGENGVEETAVSLPLGTQSYKIEINQDGIYDITGADLAAAGMTIANINPANIQMMSRGEAVAYTFIKKGSNSAILEEDDIIRFYGEGVNGSRREKQFLTHNVYWLWPAGAATSIATASNAPGGATVTSFTDTITREDENRFFSTWTNKWDESPNEPDSWYWDLIAMSAQNPQPITKTYTVDLPDPVIQSGQTASYTVEVLSRHDYRTNLDYQVDVCLHAASECAQKTWRNNGNANIKNFNITRTVPLTTLVSGANEFSLTLSNPVNPSLAVGVYLNRITVEYLRALKAENDQLFFTDEVGGQTMVVQDFSEGEADKILVWDISTPANPIQIDANSIGISEHNGRYTYTIGLNSATTQNYIATTTANTLTPDKISPYTAPTTLEPPQGADWVAIAYNSFLPQANTLATHRQQTQYGGLSTHVVDIQDIINVYGDGLPMPEAIHTYLEKSLTWPHKPSYVVLVGDGVISPRNLQCSYNCYDDWDKDAQNFIPTDMQFKDRYQGLIPSDNTAVFLVGDDVLADMAIGRLPAETSAEANAMVQKIIKYEQNLHAEVQGYKRVLFLADHPDPSAGGSFCNTNLNNTGTLLPADYEQIHLCIEDYVDAGEFLAEITEETTTGVSLMNYRGHGTIHAWGDNPRFWNADSTVSDATLKNTWGNDFSQKPVALLSADCLDGYFAWPGHSAISERFLGLDGMAGSAAHWSSTGLGLDSEHTTLLEGFYQGVFEHEQIRIGDAVNYAKLHYSLSAAYSVSEMYSFNLQGDPAMQVKLLDSYYVFLPSITK